MRSTSWRTALLLSGVLIVGLLPAAVASADQNEIVDDPSVVCEVTGSVDLVGEDEESDDTSGNDDDGVDENRDLGHYVFVDTSLACEGNHPNAGLVAGVYVVNASGDTDSIQHDGAGENTTDGGWDQNDADGDGKTTGVLSASLSAGEGPASFSCGMKFHRLYTVVVVYCQLEDGKAAFSAVLQFTPTSGTGQKGDPITSAELTGTAQLGTTTTPVPEKV